MGKCANVGFVAAVLLLGLVVVVGCGSDRLPLGDVSGTVTYDGQPLEKGSITFEVTGVRSATGKIVNGEIVEVTTFEAGDGAPVGKARVAISSVEEGPPAEEEVPDSPDAPGSTGGMPVYKSLIPTKYANPETSGLTAVVEDGDNALTFELLSK